MPTNVAHLFSLIEQTRSLTTTHTFKFLRAFIAFELVWNSQHGQGLLELSNQRLLSFLSHATMALSTVLLQKFYLSLEVLINPTPFDSYFVSSKYIALVWNFNGLHQIFFTHMDSSSILILDRVCVVCAKSSTNACCKTEYVAF